MEKAELNQIWSDLEKDSRPTDAHGSLTRRIASDSGFDIRVVVEKPSNRRGLLVSVGGEHHDLARRVPECSGFEFKRLGSESAGNTTYLLRSNEARHFELFAGVISDVLDRMCSATSEQDGVSRLVARLIQWQTFFRSGQPDGLTEEEQRGLYGELWFFKRLLEAGLFADLPVRSWVGPIGGNQDFQFPSCAVECKVTIGAQDQRLRISSERQLDSTGTSALFVLHHSLDARVGSGENLNGIVKSIRVKLDELGVDREAFEDLLFRAGYLDLHWALYESVCYTHREVNYFWVKDNFPRIVETELRTGVQEVKYSISVTECKHFSVAEEAVLSRITNHNV